MNKPFFLASSIAITLSACSGLHKPKPQTHAIPTEAKIIAQSASANTKRLKKDKKNTGIIAYFDAAGTLQSSPQKGGFYRILLGRNRAGQAVVQDFYQDNQTKQTNAMVIPNDAYLTNFDSTHAEGRVIWYSPDGKVKQFIDYHQGFAEQGGYYNNAGKLILESKGDNSLNPDNPITIRGFYENGQLLFENKQKNNFSETVFYYETGQKMWHSVSNSETVHAWAKDGRPVDLTEIDTDSIQAEKHAHELMNLYFNN